MPLENSTPLFYLVIVGLMLIMHVVRSRVNASDAYKVNLEHKKQTALNDDQFNHHIKEGKRIKAIKRYRVITGCGLVEVMKDVDQLILDGKQDT